MKNLVLVSLIAAVGVAASSPPASAAPCGLPDVSPLHVEFGDGSVPFRNTVFRRPGVIVSTNGNVGAEFLRQGGAQTTYWWMKLENLVGFPDAPLDPATIEAAADRLYEHAVASTLCATPYIALNELWKPTAQAPLTPTNTQYRANVLALLQRLSARGARPFLLVPSDPNTIGESLIWWQQVAQVSDIVREVYFPAPRIDAQGPLVGSRTLRMRMRQAVRSVTGIGVPAERVGLMLGFQSGGMYGRAGLQPLPSWLRFVKLNALAARHVAAELGVGTVWSWGWGTFNTTGADPDKPTAACVYLWTRDSGLCDAPTAAGLTFNTSLSEGQILLPDDVHCATAVGRISNDALAETTALTKERELAASALFARLVQRTRARFTAEAVLRAEELVVQRRFRGDRELLLAALHRRGATLAAARDVLADELRRQRIPKLWSWTTARQTRVLERTTCRRDELPTPGEVRLADFLPFLKLPA